MKTNNKQQLIDTSIQTTSQQFNPKQFGWKEMFSSEQTGKTSIILFVSGLGAIITAILLVSLVILCAIKSIESAVVISLIESVLTYYGISVGLLGVRSITSSFGGNKVTVSNITNSDGSTTTRQTIKKKIYNTIDSSVIDNNKIEVSETEEIS